MITIMKITTIRSCITIHWLYRVVRCCIGVYRAVYSCFYKGCLKSVKVHATMPSGIMGSNSLVLLSTGFMASNKKEGEGINTSVFAVSFSNAETP